MGGVDDDSKRTLANGSRRMTAVCSHITTLRTMSRGSFLERLYLSARTAVRAFRNDGFWKKSRSRGQPLRRRFQVHPSLIDMSRVQRISAKFKHSSAVLARLTNLAWFSMDQTLLVHQTAEVSSH